MQIFGIDAIYLLGALLLVLVISLIVLAVIGAILVILFWKTRKVIIPRFTLFLTDLFSVPIKHLVWLFKIDDEAINKMSVDLRNRLYVNTFSQTPYMNRAIFMPQCLRSTKCTAPTNEEGIQCTNCGKCGLGMLKIESEKLGYKFFIAPGGTLVKRMVRKYRPTAVLGVACSSEAIEGSEKLAAYGIPVQGIILSRDGCVNTRVDIVKLMEKMKSYSMDGKYSIENDPEWMNTAIEISKKWDDSMPVEVEIVDAREKYSGRKW